MWKKALLLVIPVVAFAFFLLDRDPGPSHWVGALGSESQRVEAWMRLQGSDDPEVLDAVVHGARSAGHPSVRAYCANLLAHLKYSDGVPAEVVDALSGRLEDPAYVVRMRAAQSLVDLLDIGRLNAILEDGGRSIRARAALARGLVEQSSPDFGYFLQRWLEDRGTHPSLRATAANLLGDCCRQRDLWTALERRALDPTENPGLRAGCLKSLGAMRRGAALPVLRKIYLDPAQPCAVREGAVLGMGRSRDDTAIPLLIAILSDLSLASSIRASAAEALSCSRDPRALAAFQGALRDVIPSVRLRAARAVGCDGSPALIPAVRAALEVETTEEAERALRAALTTLEGSVRPPSESAPPRR